MSLYRSNSSNTVYRFWPQLFSSTPNIWKEQCVENKSGSLQRAKIALTFIRHNHVLLPRQWVPFYHVKLNLIWGEALIYPRVLVQKMHIMLIEHSV